jgi:hypothetical protein
MKRSSSWLAGLTLLLLAPLAHAQFVGNYTLTPPSGAVYTSNVTLGAWDFANVTSGSGGSASLDSSGAPNSFVLTSSQFGMGGTNNANLTLAASVPLAGTINFDYSLVVTSGLGASGIFSYQKDLVSSSFGATTTGTASWNVVPGDTLGFYVNSIGGSSMSMGFMNTPIFTPTQGSAQVTISNFSFTPAIPEPADFGTGAGLLALGVALWRRRWARA